MKEGDRKVKMREMCRGSFFFFFFLVQFLVFFVASSLS